MDDDKKVGEQVSSVVNVAKEGIANAVEKGSDLAGRAQKAAVQAGSTIQDAAIETSKQVSDAAAKTYDQGAQALEYVRRNTSEQPLLALLIAGAIGYGIAYMNSCALIQRSSVPELSGAGPVVVQTQRKLHRVLALPGRFCAVFVRVRDRAQPDGTIAKASPSSKPTSQGGTFDRLCAGHPSRMHGPTGNLAVRHSCQHLRIGFMEPPGPSAAPNPDVPRISP